MVRMALDRFKRFTSLSALVRLLCTITICALWAALAYLANGDYARALTRADERLATVARSYSAYAMALADISQNRNPAYRPLLRTRDEDELDNFRASLRLPPHMSLRLLTRDGHLLAGDPLPKGEETFSPVAPANGSPLLEAKFYQPDIGLTAEADYNEYDALTALRAQYEPRIVILAATTFVILLLGFVSLRVSRKRDAANRRWKAFFNASLDGTLVAAVVAHDPAHCTIIEANTAAQEILKNWSDNCVGCAINDCIPAWARVKVAYEQAESIRTAAPRTYRIVSPNRQEAFSITVVPLSEKYGEAPTQLIMRIRDVRDLEQNKIKLEAAIYRAEEASKAKSAILANTSHELRTPLNAIIGYSELMSLGLSGPLTDKQKDYVGIIHKSGRHLLDVITDILDLAKIESGYFELREAEIDAGELLDTCLDLVRPRADEKQLRLVRPDAKLPRLYVDPLRLRQIIVNLLSNAVKFTQSGQVALEAVRTEQGGIALTVSDTGAGMTEEELTLAMEPFRQTESSNSQPHEGTGLGLPLAKKLTLLHGGLFDMTSQKGKGTRVTLTFGPERVRAMVAAA